MSLLDSYFEDPGAASVKSFAKFLTPQAQDALLNALRRNSDLIGSADIAHIMRDPVKRNELLSVLMKNKSAAYTPPAASPTAPPLPSYNPSALALR